MSDFVIKFFAMLQEKIVIFLSQELGGSSQELKQYKKANHSLRKKLKEKQSKIHQLFGYIQDAAKVIPSFMDTNTGKNYSIVERNNKLTLSQNRKKEKQNKFGQNYQDYNIFKQPSHAAIQKIYKQDIRLPSLQKKGKNMFADEIIQNPQKRAKVVRIPLQRLKPIDSDEIKKRFLKKYPRLQNNID